MDKDTAYGLNLAIDVGEDDPWRPNVELLHERMLSRGIAHRFEVLPGEHAAEYWIDNVDHYLAFYSSRAGRHLPTNRADHRRLLAPAAPRGTVPLSLNVGREAFS